MEIVHMTIPPNGDGYTRNEEVAMLRAELASATKALEPFAREVYAESLSKALGHITREHLLNARDIYRSLTDGAKP